MYVAYFLNIIQQIENRYENNLQFVVYLVYDNNLQFVAIERMRRYGSYT